MVRILEIKHKKKADLTKSDYEHMRKVVGYVHRHLKQGGPKDDNESLKRQSIPIWIQDKRISERSIDTTSGSAID